MPHSAAMECPKVLLVDDDPVLRTLTRAALEVAGFEVIESDGGGDLPRQVRAASADLVLLDVLMPTVDGFEACAALLAEAGGIDVPVVMMTGLDDVESINRAYEVGATDFVTKPLNHALLVHRLRYVLRAKRLARELQTRESQLATGQRIARLGYWEAGLDGGFRPWNAQTQAVFGLTPGIAIASVQQLLGLVDTEHRERVQEAFAAAARGERSFAVEFRMDTPVSGLRDMRLDAVIESHGGGVPMYYGTVQDLTERRRAERQIERLSFYDPVTGLANRTLLRRELSAALARSQRAERPLAVLSLGVDNFQRINTTLGFEAGNRLLRLVAERLKDVVRGGDSVGRRGLGARIAHQSLARGSGDGFVIVLPEIDAAEDAAGVAARVRSEFEAPVQIGETEVFVSVSIGISIYPDDGVTPDELLAHADSALAHAKREGRDSSQFYTATLNVRAFKRLALESSLRRALSNREFELYYQPKIDCARGTVVGAEALVRWNHPELGRISPAEFIPLAEEIGLIVPLGEWVLAAACAELQRCDSDGLALGFAVNLSAAQFRKPDLARRVAALVEEAGIDPRRIELELTESLLMADARAAVSVLTDLKALGVTLAIDDFGTGYSSLSYLKRLPVDVIKIDQSFIREIGNADGGLIVDTVIKLARGLRLQTVAEGVEVAAQLEFLKRSGCGIAQGYLFSAPLPAPEFRAWCAARAAPRAVQGVA